MIVDHKKIIVFFMMLVVGLCLGVASPAWAKKKSKGNPKYASIVIDADTGVVLSERYADKVLHPASLTKMMTLLLAFEAMDRGQLRLKERVRISNHAASMVPSKLGLPAGSSIRVQDAIYSLVTKSANDVAVALAEHIGGSEAKFAMMMTERARTIGMTRTKFRNASGLHNKYQVSTARDMAKLGRYILQRYPHYYRYFSTKSFTYRGKTYRNHNKLLGSYQGMDGFKTGYINASGFNLVASAKRGNRRIIGVVFGGRSSKTRNDHMATILDAGFKKAGRIRIASLVEPPKPYKKPGMGEPVNDFAVMNEVAINSIKPDYVAINEKIRQGHFGEELGQGDIDPSVSKRIETGMIAVAMHKGDYKTDNVRGDVPVLPHPKNTVGKWSIQIGAYVSPEATQEALAHAKKKLPVDLSDAVPLTMPLRTADGMVYRARLGGLSEAEAQRACRFFSDCMAVMPISPSIVSAQ